jgi:Haem-binding domain
MDTPNPNETPRAPGTGQEALSWLRSNSRIVALVLTVTVAAYLVSLAIGLNPLFTTGILLLFVLTVWVVHRWRTKKLPTSRQQSISGVFATCGFAAVVCFALIQAVPYGRSHSNGPIVSEPVWPDATTRALAARACFDCHSNEVRYPSYANIAPISWLVEEHVSDGRNAVNFSDLSKRGEGAGNVIEVVQEGSMPPPYFTRFGLHSKAKLSKAEIATLIAGLRKMPEFKGR